MVMGCVFFEVKTVHFNNTETSFGFTGLRIFNLMYFAQCTYKDNNYRYQEIKSKAVPLHAMEAHGGRGGIAPTHS
jgi:hypothetical protein